MQNYFENKDVQQGVCMSVWRKKVIKVPTVLFKNSLKTGSKNNGQNRFPLSKAFVPLAFPAGEVCQFDWSQEIVELGSVTQTIKVAHFRMAHSRKMFVVAYPNETQEMVFDAHNQAFKFFDGVPKQMIYDNLKTVVDAIFVGKERQFNRRFLTLANHYMFEPVACTPASGWKKDKLKIKWATSVNGYLHLWQSSTILKN